jgi:hypothetical protein
MDIYKAGSQDMPVAVYELPCSVFRDLADPTNMTALDSDVSNPGLASAPVHDVCIPDERIAERHTIFLQETFNIASE